MWIRNNVELLYHPGGNARMGRPETSVVDPELRVYGVNVLGVVDASVTPTTTRGNTNAPVIMIRRQGSREDDRSAQADALDRRAAERPEPARALATQNGKNRAGGPLRELSVRSDVKPVMVKSARVIVLIVVVAMTSLSPAFATEGASTPGDDAGLLAGSVETTAPSPPAQSDLQHSSQVARDSETPSPIVFEDGFDSLSLWGGRSPSSRNKVNLTRNGFDGPGLRVTIPRGSHFGADFKLDLSKELGEDPETLFFRYFLRFDPDWAPASAGKLPGFSGVYSSTGLGGYPSRPYAPGWSSRMEFFPTREGDPRAALGYYVYHLGQEERYGDSMRWGEAGKLVPGEWYCLEGEIQLNSLGRADGRLRSWVDGTPAFNASGLEFRRPSEPDIRVESFWFNVYYGGKTVPSSDLGLTIDSVAVGSDRLGCGLGAGTTRPVEADIDGDGFDDEVVWGACRGGPCFRLETVTATPGPTVTRAGDGAWFSLQTHRLGMSSGDLDGDGRDELIYRGRCDGSVKCWRVHRSTGSALSSGEDWGGGARFASTAATVVLGDWDGDGRDDVAYQGRCKGSATDCWRVHRSLGASLAAPEDWGTPPAESLSPYAADVTGDGNDDLVYTAPCGNTMCWYAQPSLGAGFGEAVKLGRAPQHQREGGDFIDFDGDGLDDLVTVRSGESLSRVEVRLMGDSGFGAPEAVAVVNAAEADIELSREGTSGRTEAVLRWECEQRAPCGQHLVASWTMELLSMADFHQRSVRLGDVRAL